MPIVTVAPLTLVPVTIFVTVPLNVVLVVGDVAGVGVGDTGVVELSPPQDIDSAPTAATLTKCTNLLMGFTPQFSLALDNV